MVKFLTGEPTEYNLAELARLRIRYRGFPGSRDIWSDIEKVLARWNMDEEGLFEKNPRDPSEKVEFIARQMVIAKTGCNPGDRAMPCPFFMPN